MPMEVAGSRSAAAPLADRRRPAAVDRAHADRARRERRAGNGRGTISLAGALLDAELPRGLHGRAGDPSASARGHARQGRAGDCRSARRCSDQPVPMPLPGGGTFEIRERRRRAAAATEARPRTRSRSSTTRRRSARSRCGSCSIPRSLKLEVALSPGEPYAARQRHADELQQALSTALQRTITLSILPRREPVEIYA